MACDNEDCPRTSTKTLVCSRCKNIRFCSKSCQQACHSWHKKLCIDPKKAAFSLMKCCLHDQFTYMTPELKKSYGFEKCKSETDLSYMLGLYQGLIKILGCDINDIDKAFNENKLPEFIVSTFFENTRPENCGEYFKWYLKDIDRCRH